MTEREACALIEAIAGWLRQYDAPWSNDPADGIDPGVVWYAGPSKGETRSAQLARHFSEVLLDSSTANSMGGCPLCQS